jgi:hypothetical protein
LDRQAFDFLSFVLHHECPIAGLNSQRHIFPNQGLADVVGHCIDAHTCISSDFPHVGLPVQNGNPAVGVHNLGNGRPRRQIGECEAWRLVVAASSLVRALVVVMLPESCGDCLHGLKIARAIHSQTFFIMGAMVAFDGAVPSRI